MCVPILRLGEEHVSSDIARILMHWLKRHKFQRSLHKRVYCSLPAPPVTLTDRVSVRAKLVWVAVPVPPANICFVCTKSFKHSSQWKACSAWFVCDTK